MVFEFTVGVCSLFFDRGQVLLGCGVGLMLRGGDYLDHSFPEPASGPEGCHGLRPLSPKPYKPSELSVSTRALEGS